MGELKHISALIPGALARAAVARLRRLEEEGDHEEADRFRRELGLSERPRRELPEAAE